MLNCSRGIRVATGLLLLAAAPAFTQPPAKCACGTAPPKAPQTRELRPYAGAPEDMRPYTNFTAPYYSHYEKLVEYNGAARELPVVKADEVDEVRIGFLGPVENHRDQALGRMMRDGSQLAIDEANATGGYGGKQFKLLVH